MPATPTQSQSAAHLDPGPDWEAYCATCDDDLRFELRDITHVIEVRGESIHTRVPGYVCPGCGHVRSHSQHDPLEAAYRHYRQAHSLLQPEAIRGLRERYGLSQDAFAKLLGVSPATIARYEGGSLQDEPHDHLLRACERPDFMRELVAQHGDRLTPLQLHRFDQALAKAAQPLRAPLWIETVTISDKYTGFRPFSYLRSAFMIRGLCDIAGQTFNTKLNKLCFYADFLAAKQFGKSISGLAYQRIKMGPVPHDYGALLDRLVDDGFLIAEELDFPQPDGTSFGGTAYRAGELTPPTDVALGDAMKVITHVATTFHHVPRPQIVERSHREVAWINTPDKKLISYEHAASLSLSLNG